MSRFEESRKDAHSYVIQQNVTEESRVFYLDGNEFIGSFDLNCYHFEKSKLFFNEYGLFMRKNYGKESFCEAKTKVEVTISNNSNCRLRISNNCTTRRYTKTHPRMIL